MQTRKQDSPEARGRQGQKRWEPAISEYRESAMGAGMVRSAARLMQTTPPKDEESLMAAATQVWGKGLLSGMMNQNYVADSHCALMLLETWLEMTLVHPMSCKW